LRRRKIRTKLHELGATLVVALALGGCGSGGERAAPAPPRLPASLAADLASRGDDVVRLLESNDGCGALAAAKALQTETIAAINARRVPARLQEPLLGAANDLTVRITCAPPPPEKNGKTKDKKHGKGHGKGKHGDDGDEG
jgi:hypothetical protein